MSLCPHHQIPAENEAVAQAERVFQIFLSTDDGSLPPVLETASKTVQAAFPQCVHQLWRDAQVRQFID